MKKGSQPESSTRTLASMLSPNRLGAYTGTSPGNEKSGPYGTLNTHSHLISKPNKQIVVSRLVNKGKKAFVQNEHMDSTYRDIVQ